MFSCVSTVTPNKNVGILRIKWAKKMSTILKKDFLPGKRLQNVFTSIKTRREAAASYHLVVPQCVDVGESMNSQLPYRGKKKRA